MFKSGFVGEGRGGELAGKLFMKGFHANNGVGFSNLHSPVPMFTRGDSWQYARDQSALPFLPNKERGLWMGTLRGTGLQRKGESHWFVLLPTPLGPSLPGQGLCGVHSTASTLGTVRQEE